MFVDNEFLRTIFYSIKVKLWIFIYYIDLILNEHIYNSQLKLQIIIIYTLTEKVYDTRLLVCCLLLRLSKYINNWTDIFRCEEEKIITYV